MTRTPLLTVRQPPPGLFEAQGNVLSASEQARGQTAAAQANALGNAASSRYGAVASAYAPYAGMLGQTGGNLAQLFDSYGKNSGQYFNAISNLGANAMNSAAGVNTGLFSAYAGGNQAYQNTLGGLGTAALAGYGSAANAAMQAQAMNSTAALKAMSDAIAANQGAVAAYGTGRDQSLAAIANAAGLAGGNIANAFAQNATAAGNMAGQGSAALANLGGQMGTALGNTATGGAQAEAANRAAAMSALSNLGTGGAASQAALRGNLGSAMAQTQVGQAQGLSNLGASGNAALGGLGAPIANAAANDLTFTRDMAKLGLARELGIVGANAMSGMGGGGQPFGFQLSGPDGVFASGGAPGFGAFGGQFMNPQTNVPWYAQRQASDQSGLRALGGLQAGIQSDTAARAGQIDSGGRRVLDTLGSEMQAGAQDIDRSVGRASAQAQGESAAGSRNISDFTTSALGDIRQQGDAAGGGILAALTQGGRQIDDSAAGIRGASGDSFGGINRSLDGVMGSTVLGQLGSGFDSGMSQLRDAFQQGQRDPRDIFGGVLNDIQKLSAPYLDAAGRAMGDFYNNFPEGPAWGGSPGGSVDPTPYLNELRGAWDPYIGNLNNAYRASFDGLFNLAGQAQGGFNQALSGIGGAPTMSMFGDSAVDLNALNPYAELMRSQRAGVAAGRSDFR